MRTLLNSIALEPNRWTKEKIAAHDLEQDLLPKIGASRFEHVEVWQFHISRKSLDEVKSIRAQGDSLGLDFPVVGVYPTFHLEGAEGEAERTNLKGIVDRSVILGAKQIKFFFGAVKGHDITAEELARTTRNVTDWIHYGKEHGISFCAELHNGTLFQPYEYGKAYLKEHPELDLKICFQPYDFERTDPSLALIEELGSDIVHAHFQGRDAEGFCLLKDATVDYRKLIPALAKANPDLIPSVEFVKRGFPKRGEAFDFEGALADAEADASLIDELLAK